MISTLFGFLPFDHGRGILQPCVTELILHNVHYDETLTAGDICQFDTGMVVATTFHTDGLDSNGISTSAFGRVRDPDVSSATAPVNETSIYGEAMDSVTGSTTAITAKGRVRILGSTTTLVKVASATDAAGTRYMVSMGGIGKISVLAAVPTTLVTTIHLRKVVAVATTAAATTTFNGYFNGFGMGYVIQNCAYANDNS
jgi:hypothetical protein